MLDAGGYPATLHPHQLDAPVATDMDRRGRIDKPCLQRRR